MMTIVVIFIIVLAFTGHSQLNKKSKICDLNAKNYKDVGKTIMCNDQSKIIKVLTQKDYNMDSELSKLE